MKNKLYYILLGVLISFSCIETVFAAELKFNVTATPDATEVVKGKEVSITLNLKSDSEIDTCQFQVVADSNLEFVSMNSMNDWTKMGTVANFTLEKALEKVQPLTSGENALVLKYKVNGDGKITVKTVECAYSKNTNEVDSGTHDDVVVNLTAKEVSEDNTLSNLEVTGGTLTRPITTPSENNQYSIILDSPKYGLKATASNPEYQNKIVFKDVNGNVISDPLNMTYVSDGGQPLQKITITVNDKMTYELLVSYEQKELDNSLKSVTINGANLPLKKGQTDYEYTIGKDVTSFEVSAVLNDSTNFKFGDGSNFEGKITIKDIAYVNIEVVPIDSSSGATSQLYTITVTREGSLDNDTTNNNDKPVVNPPSSGSSGSNSSNNSNNVNNNPITGDISMFLMAIILIASLVGSIFLYQKNLESYK